MKEHTFAIKYLIPNKTTEAWTQASTQLLLRRLHSYSQSPWEYKVPRHCRDDIPGFILWRSPTLGQHTNIQQWTFHTSALHFIQTILYLLICQTGHIRCHDTIQMACWLQYCVVGLDGGTKVYRHSNLTKWSKHLSFRVPRYLTTSRYSSNITNCTS
jgi:hypothetical protein